MHFRKRKITTYIITGFLLLIILVWGIFCIRVNREFHYEVTEVYEVGDCFTYNNCEIQVYDASLKTREELQKLCENIEEEDFDMWSIDGEHYWVLDVDVTNTTEETLRTDVALWVAACGAYGNGCSMLTDLHTPEINALPAGETVRTKMIFGILEEQLDNLEKYEMRVYTSLYPEVRYISCEAKS